MSHGPSAQARLNQPLTGIPPEIASVADYEPYARRCLDDNAWTYLTSGAGDELTMTANREAFDRCFLRGRVLGEMSGASTRMSLFGQAMEHPILLAPVAHQKLFHPDGELASVQAAGALETTMVVSTLASFTLEEIARHAQAPVWFQLYIQPDRAFTVELVRRAESAGYGALVITVDAPIVGARNREQRIGFHLPPGIEAVNLHGALSLDQLSPSGSSRVFDRLMAHAATWKDIELIRKRTALPILLKGITAPCDALRALDAGVDGLIVSNHGGRTLDTLAPTLRLLPEIVSVVQGRAPILMDGGIRRGTDVMKALALGASAVLIGRAWVHGLAAAGPYGVAHALRLLRDEFEIAMALTGCRTPEDICQSIVLAPQSPSGVADAPRLHLQGC